MSGHSHANQDIALQAAVGKLARPYLEFTRSMFRSEERRLMDLRELIKHPRIRRIAFLSGSVDSDEHAPDIDWLILGTTHVQIYHNRARYNIGEFLLYIARKNSAGANYPQVLAENVTQLGSPLGGAQYRPDDEKRVRRYAHPHVGGNPAQFCMNGDSAALNEALAEGDLPTVFEILDAALHSTGPGNAYCDVWNWPNAGLERN